MMSLNIELQGIFKLKTLFHKRKCKLNQDIVIGQDNHSQAGKCTKVKKVYLDENNDTFCTENNYDKGKVLMNYVKTNSLVYFFNTDIIILRYIYSLKYFPDGYTFANLKE